VTVLPPARTGPEGGMVRAMFASIAPRYDFLNHFLSLSVDRYWRRRVVRLLRGHHPSSDDRCLDVCAGTGDLALDIHRRLHIRTTGTDFCHPMLVRFLAKLRPSDAIVIVESDAECLPFAEESFRFVTIAFGLRNIEQRQSALEEMLRVVQPGGVLVVLEFSKPVIPVVGSLFDLYFRHVLPKLGAWISGARGPYAYLPASVKQFPDQSSLAEELQSTGWFDVGYQNLTGGIAALHWGRKPTVSSSPRGEVGGSDRHRNRVETATSVGQGSRGLGL